MRRFLSLFTVLMLCNIIAFAQTRVVSGKVIDPNGKGVPFASVVVKSSGTGTNADVNGDFSLRASNSDVLVASSTGYQDVETTVGTRSYITIALTSSTATTIQEVVVTSAFNTKRTLRSQSSNVQNVSSEQLNVVRQPDINNALAGKVAGSQVRSQSSAKLGAGAVLRLRGENGLGVGGGALYVVNGTIVPSSTDINTDDVEDVTVLQGPAAAALFGPDGANGAVVVTLKKGKKTSDRIGLDINSGVTFDRIYITPAYQNAYAGGGVSDLMQYTWKPGDPEGWKALDGKYYHDYTDDASWGPRMVGQEYIPWYAWYPGTEYSYKTAPLVGQPNNIRDYFSTGVTLSNNVSFSKAGDNYNARISYTNLNIQGIVPTSKLNRHNFSTNLGIDLTSKLSVNTSINYMNQFNNSENNDGYANQSTGSFSQWFHRDLDMNMMRTLRGLRTPEGIYASWNHANPNSYNASNPTGFYAGNYWFNHYTYFDLINLKFNRDRLYGDLGFTYKFTPDFSVRATYRRNQLYTDGSQIFPYELEQGASQGSFNPFEGNNKAAYGISNSKSVRQNYELVGSYSKKIKDWAVNANAGLDILRTNLTTYDINTINGLNVPGLYTLSNSASTPQNSFSSTGNTQGYSKYARRGVFLRGDLGYQNTYFVEGTIRKDYASAEPKGKGITSYSVGGSLVFSEFMKGQDVLSFGKLRASIGSVVNALGAYNLYNLYSPNAGSIFTMSEPNTLIDPTLHGSTNIEKEIGIETRWFKNRLGLTATYWDRTNKDFPLNVAINGASGYTSFRTNAGEIAKKGFDLSAFVVPVRMNNLEWRIDASYGKLIKNEVVSIAPGVRRIVSASGAFSGTSSAYLVSQEGQEWGQIFGNGIKRVNGKPVLTSAGLFIKEDTMNFGSSLPEFTGGVQNSFKIFKNLTLNVNIDFQKGGKFYSLSSMWSDFSGLSAKTAALNDKGFSVRDAVADGGGVRVDGVDAAGHDVTYYVEAQSYFHQFRNAYIAEPYVYDLTFVKMRELSLGYDLPTKRLGIGKYVKNATFSIIARNPFLLYSKTRDFDPSEISNSYGEDGQMPGTRSMGVNLRLGF